MTCGTVMSSSHSSFSMAPARRRGRQGRRGEAARAGADFVVVGVGGIRPCSLSCCREAACALAGTCSSWRRGTAWRSAGWSAISLNRVGHGHRRAAGVGGRVERRRGGGTRQGGAPAPVPTGQAVLGAARHARGRYLHWGRGRRGSQWLAGDGSLRDGRHEIAHRRWEGMVEEVRRRSIRPGVAGSGDGFVGWTGGDSPAAIPVAASGACGRKKRKKK